MAGAGCHQFDDSFPAFWPCSSSRAAIAVEVRTGTLTEEPNGPLERHEHTRSGLQCWEDHQWRPLISAYDLTSAMFYPQCGGLSADFQLSDADKDGAACLYGAASGYSPDCSYRGLRYRGHAAGIGWLPWVRDRDIAGTVGQGCSLEGLRVWLTGACF